MASIAKRRINRDDIEWADHIFVMEQEHASELRYEYRPHLASVELHVLDIPDEFDFMDPELIELIESGVDRIMTDH